MAVSHLLFVNKYKTIKEKIKKSKGLFPKIVNGFQSLKVTSATKLFFAIKQPLMFNFFILKKKNVSL